MRFSRLRGVILRLGLSRPAAMIVGIGLSAGAWFMPDWGNGTSAGLAVILGATGLALIFMAISGRRPDWIDPE